MIRTENNNGTAYDNEKIGEVTCPSLLFDKKTGKPYKSGLFDEQIFGSLEEWQAETNEVFGNVPVFIPSKVIGKIGKIVLAMPICSIDLPKGVEEKDWVSMTELMVLPPVFRPIKVLKGPKKGEWVSSVYNQFYMKIISRNERLKKLLALPDVSQIIITTERKCLQTAVFELKKEVEFLLNEKPTASAEVRNMLDESIRPLKIAESPSIIIKKAETLTEKGEQEFSNGRLESARNAYMAACDLCNESLLKNRVNKENIDGILTKAKSLLRGTEQN